MKVIQGTDVIPPELKEAFITIGNFDGIHLGHRHIFQTMIQEASRTGQHTVLVTFVPHPKMVLHPERRPFFLLTTLEEKLKLLEEQGLDAVILIPFTLAYAETSAQSFIDDFLWNTLRVRKVFIGHDYTFGKGKGGNAGVLAAHGKELGFDVTVINPVTVGGAVVSSTGIRKAILGGDVRTAATFLGRPYNVSGTVIKGKGRGASLGFPTANVKPDKELLPARGVYAAMVNLDGGRYRSVLSIGVNPTFTDGQLTLEVYLMDFNSDIYGKQLEILFVDRLREEQKFPGPEALALQIKKDVEQARTILNPYLH